MRLALLLISAPGFLLYRVYERRLKANNVAPKKRKLEGQQMPNDHEFMTNTEPQELPQDTQNRQTISKELQSQEVYEIHNGTRSEADLEVFHKSN